MKVSFSVRPLVRRRLVGAGLTAVVAGLAGCYVVPIDARTGQPVTVPATNATAPVPPPGPVVFPARLYPANDLASPYGMISATVTNDLHGRGTFNASINGESFSGEATRKAGSSRDGVANGAGNRGGFLACQYTMNSSTLGTGSCRLNNGAVFTMHVGN